MPTSTPSSRSTSRRPSAWSGKLAALAAGGEGRVVTIVSLSGKRVKTAGSGVYAVSKFAALGLAHAIRHAAGTRACARPRCAPASSPPTWRAA